METRGIVSKGINLRDLGNLLYFYVATEKVKKKRGKEVDNYLH